MADPAYWTTDGKPLPVLSAEDRAAAERALAVYAEAPRGTEPGRISAFVGMAATCMPTRAGSEPEEDARLAAYQEDLADIDDDVLEAAFREARRTLTFFPTIAELRTIAGRLPAPPRVWKAWRLRQLLARQTAASTADPVDVGDVGALLEKLRPEAPDRTASLPARATYRSVPTLEDYRALGLNEEEALEQWQLHLDQHAGRDHGALPHKLAA